MTDEYNNFIERLVDTSRSNETVDQPIVHRNKRFSGLIPLPHPKLLQLTYTNNLASKSSNPTPNIFFYFTPKANNNSVSHLTTCHIVTQSESFFFHSPGFPAIYPPNVDCFYSIKKLSSTCSVELDLREFYMEPIPDCSGDWLLIGEKKYCGQHTSTKGLNFTLFLAEAHPRKISKTINHTTQNSVIDQF